MPRRKKPGPKPRKGRPSTARRREYERDRATQEREDLRASGYEVFVMVAPADQARSLKRASRINRLDGLAQAAETRNDDEEMERLAHRREIAVIENQQQVRQENEQRLQEERDLRRKIRARQPQPQNAGVIAPKPSWMA
jgi:predicted TIM-barrel fold metal-dependent hydrolase